MRTKIVTIFALLLIIAVNAQDKKWTLQECIDYALDHNISIKQQELTKDLISEDIVTAKGNFLPSLGASASQYYNFGSYNDTYGDRISIDSRSNNFSLSSSTTLYSGNSNKYTLMQAKKSLEAAGYDLEENKNGIMLYVVNYYLDILLNKENIIIAKDQVEISKKQVENTSNLVNAGSEPKSSLLEAEATLASNEEQLVSAYNSLDLSLLSLAQLLQVSHKNFNIVDVTLNINSASLIYNDTDQIFNTALNTLPEIKSAKLAVENSELSVKIAKASFLPTLTFNANAGTTYQHIQGESDVTPVLDESTGLVVYEPNGFGKQLEDNLGYYFGASLSIPIFNRFQTKSSVAKAQINKESSELMLLDKEIKLRETIEKAYLDAKASLNQFISAEKSLKAQNELFKNAQESYNLGVMTSFDFDQVRNRLVNAQSSMVNAKYNFVFRTKLLEYYLGIPIVIE